MNPQIRIRVLLVAVCAFLFFYGLGAFGLLGADEPRYAQIAREMLARHDWITPTLNGHAWLEKPVLYYWQAMLVFSVAGVTGQAARIPAAVDASALVAAIYFFLRRSRPGSELDGAIVAASSAGMIGFARAAATDMPLASTFSIALLAWYAFYESDKANTRSRAYLAIFYAFLALGTLAKGPVAPAFAAIIIIAFAAVRRDWTAIRRSLWIPAIALYCAITLPWYIAVQIRNPQFFRFFILEHNLGRFSQDLYHHRQPFWFYVPVFLVAMMPWSLLLLLALAERVSAIWSAGKKNFRDPKNAWPLFLLLWMLVPIVFFSASHSKLPGYILPAVPAGALLVTQYLASIRSADDRSLDLRVNDLRPHGSQQLKSYVAVMQGIICGVLILAAFEAPSFLLYHRFVMGKMAMIGAAVAALFAIGIIMALLSRSGIRLLSRVTLVSVVVSVAVLIRAGAPVIDDTQSARPVAEMIQSYSQQPVPFAIYRINRVQQYGLEFYLNRPAQAYDTGDVPSEPHILVAKQNTQVEAATVVAGRRVSYLSSIPSQKLDLYWVGK
jgi:4-amino-4-deoxy-L-arabinose transferase-like glycosyltransferase